MFSSMEGLTCTGARSAEIAEAVGDLGHRRQKQRDDRPGGEGSEHARHRAMAHWPRRVIRSLPPVA